MNLDFSVIDTFVKKWNVSDTLKSNTNEAISNVENELNIELPKSYKFLIKNYGNLYTPNILDAIVDNDYDLNDVQNFETINKVVKDTINFQQAGLPVGFFVFGSDSMGNLFCLKNSECADENIEPPIWFFDHDFVEIEKIAENLLSWLHTYNEL